MSLPCKYGPPPTLDLPKIPRPLTHQFPTDFQAYWIRFTSNKDTTATLVGMTPFAFGKSGASGAVECELAVSHSMCSFAR